MGSPIAEVFVDVAIEVDGLTLSGSLARPSGLTRAPGLVLCHGLPSGPRGAATYAATYPELAERIARDSGWTVLTFNFRGAGGSPGDFSISAWQRDLQAAVDLLADREDVSGVWIAGSSLGGSLAICVAADDERVRGVVTLGAPASLREWVCEPGQFLEHARTVGLITDPAFPADREAWEHEVATLDPLDAAKRLAPRPLFVIHGSDDDVVPLSDARALVDAGGSGAELRVVHAAGHRLRHDPRAVAALLGWLDRQLP
ncbi:MAG: alpha/beta hydrolase family protein [Acidimicrobiia bacterium]